MKISFFVEGDPIPQGSKQAFVIPPKGISIVDMCKSILDTASKEPHDKAANKAAMAKFRSFIKAIVVDSNKDKLKGWRKLASDTAHLTMNRENRGQPLRGPVRVHLRFIKDRPKSHFRSGKSTSHMLTSTAPILPDGKPDGDKLTRALFDAMTDVCYGDDSVVCEWSGSKEYVSRDQPKPGVHVTVEQIETGERTLFDMEADMYSAENRIPF